MTKKRKARIWSLSYLFIALGFLASAPASTSGQRVKKTPTPVFSYDWKKIPPTFGGNDFEAIWRVLFNTKSLLEKDEFETTSQFTDRITNRSAIKLGSTLTAADELIFVYRPTEPSPHGLWSEYDADRQVLTITVQTNKHETYKYKSIGSDNPKITLFGTETKPHKFEKGRSYAAKNSLGAKATVTQYFYSNFYLAITNIADFVGYDKGFMSAEINLKLEVPADKARLLKSNLSVLYIADLIHPYYALGGNELQTPTIADPAKTNVLDHYLVARVKAIWIFDRTTGEVLVKLSAKN